MLPQGGELLRISDVLIRELASLPGELRFDEPLSRHTTLCVGGPAACFFQPETLIALRDAVRLCSKHGARFRVVGNGSNLLFSDDGFDGIIVVTRALRRAELELDPCGESSILRADAGASLRQIIRMAEEHGHEALGFLAGIPGTVGGAVMMNAGPRGRSLGDQVLEVAVVEPSGEVTWWPTEACGFRYRGSALLDQRRVISAVRLSLQGPRVDRRAVLEERRRKQPMDERSAGCVFRNPEGDFAGRLIDECGLKGLSVGGARVSEKHANFIVNYEGATSAEIRMVIDILRQKVYNGSHILLDLEIEVIDG